MKLTKIVAVNVAVLLALLVVFDLAGYLLLPVDWNFSGYRSEASSRTDVAGLFYPRYYFEQRATRGFDIRPAAHGVSVTNNFYFPIEANELGCRDRKFSFNAERPLIYAAGDSQTWGIVSTDARWTNLLENKSGIPVLNCGVPGTAQKHQREKYREVTSALKRQPDLVLVVYISNDVAEDAGFPAYTVIDGFLTMNNASQEELSPCRQRNRKAEESTSRRPHQRRLEALFVVGAVHQRTMEAGYGLPHRAADRHDV